jgi:hypothetical protein
MGKDVEGTIHWPREWEIKSIINNTGMLVRAKRIDLVIKLRLR